MADTQHIDAQQLAIQVAALRDAFDGVSETGQAFLDGAYTALVAVADPTD